MVDGKEQARLNSSTSKAAKRGSQENSPGKVKCKNNEGTVDSR